MARPLKKPISRLTITIEAKTENDIVLALAEVLRLVRKKYVTGWDCINTGAYVFSCNEVYEKALKW